MKNLSSEALHTLSNLITIKDHTVKINTTLDRKVYEEINEAFSRIGGKWNRSVHAFPYNPTPLIETMLLNGTMMEKNPHAFFPTPLVGVEEMYLLLGEEHRFEYASEEYPLRVLEPSAGIGAIADFIKSKTPHVELDLVEINPDNQKILCSKGYDVVCDDFMAMEVPEEEDKKYDYIFMNPPFSLKGDSFAYITHINHAMSMLKEWGTLVAIIPTGWAKNKTAKERTFRNLVATHGGCVSTLPKGTFKESGTLIETNVITLSRRSWKTQPHQGWRTQQEWEFYLYLCQEEKHYTRAEKILEKGGKDVDSELRTIVEDIIEKYCASGIYLSTDFIDQHIENIKIKLTDFYEDDVEISEVEKKETSAHIVSDDVALSILQGGGNLLDLMSA